MSFPPIASNMASFRHKLRLTLFFVCCAFFVMDSGRLSRSCSITRSQRAAREGSNASSYVDQEENDFDARVTSMQLGIGKPFVLVESVADRKFRCINLGAAKKSNANMIQEDQDEGLEFRAEGLLDNDFVLAYYGPQAQSKEGWYNSVVRGAFSTLAMARAEEKKLKEAAKKRGKKATARARHTALRRIVADAPVASVPAGGATTSSAANVTQEIIATNATELLDISTEPAVTQPPTLVDTTANNTSTPSLTSGDQDQSFGRSNDDSGIVLEDEEQQTIPRKSRMSAEMRDIVDKFYWKRETLNSHCVRPGYAVFVQNTVMKDLLDNHGPDSNRGNFLIYSWQLVLHLLGGEDTAVKLKRMGHKVGVERVLRESTLAAVKGHGVDLFGLHQSFQMVFFKNRMNNNWNNLVKRH